MHELNQAQKRSRFTCGCHVVFIKVQIDLNGLGDANQGNDQRKGLKVYGGFVVEVHIKGIYVLKSVSSQSAPSESIQVKECLLS